MGAFKAMFLGGVLSGVIALVVGTQGSSGGYLAVHDMQVGDYSLYWSWPLFLAGTGLSWGIMLLQPD